MSSYKWSTTLIPPESLMNMSVPCPVGTNEPSSVVDEHLQPATDRSTSFRLSVREQMLVQLQMKENAGFPNFVNGEAGDKENIGGKTHETVWATKELTRIPSVSGAGSHQLPLKLQMLLQLQEKEGYGQAAVDDPFASDGDTTQRGPTLRRPKAETIEMLKSQRKHSMAKQKWDNHTTKASSFCEVPVLKSTDGGLSSRSPTTVPHVTTKQPFLELDPSHKNQNIAPWKEDDPSFRGADDLLVPTSDRKRNHWQAESRRPGARSSSSGVQAVSPEATSTRCPKQHGSYEVPPRFRKPPEVKSSSMNETPKSQGETFDSFASWRAAELPNSPVAAPAVVQEEEVDIDALLLSPRDAGMHGTSLVGTLHNTEMASVSPGTTLTSSGVSGTSLQAFSVPVGNLPGTLGNCPGTYGNFSKGGMVFQETVMNTDAFPGITGYLGTNKSRHGSLSSPHGATGTRSVSPGCSGMMSTATGSSPGTPAVPYEVPGFPGTSGFRLGSIASPPGMFGTSRATPGSPLGSSGTVSRTSSLSPGTTAALTGRPLLSGTHNTSPGKITTPPKAASRTSPALGAVSPGMTSPFPALVPVAAANMDLYMLQTVNALQQQQDHRMRNLKKQQLQELQREQVLVLLLQQEAKQHKNADLVQTLTFLSQQPFKPSVAFVNEQLLSILMNAVCVQRSVTPVEQYAAQRLAQLAASERLLHT